MIADLILLAPAGTKMWTRMGVTQASDKAAAAQLVKHHALCKLHSCLIDDCRNELQADSQHGWTCADHDPLRRAATRAAAEVKNVEHI